MFIDRAVVEVRSGKGGDGSISFRREKNVPWGGPDGGNGGRGGSVYFVARSKINTLFNYRHSICIQAKDGEKGDKKLQYGKYSEDVYAEVPVGTVIYLEEGHQFLGDLNEDGKTICVAKGGRGGKGNACFKSSTNRVPKIAENGEPGETKRLILELKLLADVGLVGFPSVGKSTILSVVSSARPEIADYPFTTIVPNLGVVTTKNKEKSFVMADLPGLIEGAHLGKGLGLQFLRHIERCRVIVHVVDMGESGRDPYQDYLVINDELKEYGFGLEKRPQLVVASKMDEDGAKERLEKFKKQAKVKVYPISALLEEGMDELIYKCAEMVEQTPLFPLYGSEEEVLDTKVYQLEDEEKEFYIRRLDAHNFEIYGDKIVKFYRMTNITTDQGMMKLITHLRKLGVDDELEKMGASDGDNVILDDFEFDYVS